MLIVAAGAVLGFPLLTSWAMETLPVSHGAVELALLPLATAGIAILRAGERPSLRFWLASLVGSSAVVVYAINLGIGGFHAADIALLLAVLILGLSYAEGGKLSQEMGSWQVIAWAIVIGAPFFVIPVGFELSVEMLDAPIEAWVSLLYLAIVSQFLAYVAWYGGMALGGIPVLQGCHIRKRCFQEQSRGKCICNQRGLGRTSRRNKPVFSSGRLELGADREFRMCNQMPGRLRQWCALFCKPASRQPRLYS